MLTLKTRDLKLADVVQLSEGAYMCATVSMVTEDSVTLIRPYMHSADFSYTGGVITYTGHETVTLYRGSDRTVTVLERKDLK
jgi:hypothetical protein